MPQFSTVVVDMELQEGGWASHVNDDRPVIMAAVERVGVIRNGTEGGHPSFALLARGNDGETIFVQATWKNIALAMVALIAKWGTP